MGPHQLSTVHAAAFKQNKADMYQPVKHSLLETEIYFYIYVVMHLGE